MTSNELQWPTLTCRDLSKWLSKRKTKEDQDQEFVSGKLQLCKGPYFTSVARDSQLRLINLWSLVRTSCPLFLRQCFFFTGIQSYSYTEQRKVETDVDRMTGIELATLQLERPRANRLIYACLLSRRLLLRNNFSTLHDSTNDDSNKERCEKDPCMVFLCLRS